jgi:hypothetical protein
MDGGSTAIILPQATRFLNESEFLSIFTKELAELLTIVGERHILASFPTRNDLLRRAYFLSQVFLGPPM